MRRFGIFLKRYWAFILTWSILAALTVARIRHERAVPIIDERAPGRDLISDPPKVPPGTRFPTDVLNR